MLHEFILVEFGSALEAVLTIADETSPVFPGQAPGGPEQDCDDDQRKGS